MTVVATNPPEDGNRHERRTYEAINRKKIFRPPAAADYLDMSVSWLAKRRLKGLPPEYVRLGPRAVGYTIDRLDAYVESCRRVSTSEPEGDQ